MKSRLVYRIAVALADFEFQRIPTGVDKWGRHREYRSRLRTTGLRHSGGVGPISNFLFQIGLHIYIAFHRDALSSVGETENNIGIIAT